MQTGGAHLPSGSAGDAFDAAVCLHLAGSRCMDEVLAFLGECWKDLDRPAQVQLDNARGTGRLGASGADPVAGDPAVPVSTAGDQPRLFQRLFQRPTDLRQELSTRSSPPEARRPDAGPAPQGFAAGEIAAGLRRAGRPSAALGRA